MYALPVGTVGVALVDAPPLPLLLFENTSAPDEAVLVEAFPLVLNVDVGAVIDNDPVLFVAFVVVDALVRAMRRGGSGRRARERGSRQILVHSSRSFFVRSRRRRRDRSIDRSTD